MDDTRTKRSRAREVPLAEQTIPTALADIRRRCSDLLDENGDIRLALDDGSPGESSPGCGFDPYDHGA